MPFADRTDSHDQNVMVLRPIVIRRFLVCELTAIGCGAAASGSLGDKPEERWTTEYVKAPEERRNVWRVDVDITIPR